VDAAEVAHSSSVAADKNRMAEFTSQPTPA
jgi:hypothetical protein